MLLENIEMLRDLTLPSILLRCLLSMLLSGILGFEREKKRRPAGFRTYIVVCLGSSLAMMTGIYLNSVTGSGDAGRIAAQVIRSEGLRRPPGSGLPPAWDWRWEPAFIPEPLWPLPVSGSPSIFCVSWTGISTTTPGS